jgi:hypothetical protein
MMYANVNAMISIDDIKDHIEPHIDSMAKLAMDAEITKQFETIQKEIEGVCKQYLKELFDKYYLESGERHG